MKRRSNDVSNLDVGEAVEASLERRALRDQSRVRDDEPLDDCVGVRGGIDRLITEARAVIRPRGFGALQYEAHRVSLDFLQRGHRMRKFLTPTPAERAEVHTARGPALECEHREEPDGEHGLLNGQ